LQECYLEVPLVKPGIDHLGLVVDHLGLVVVDQLGLGIDHLGLVVVGRLDLGVDQVDYKLDKGMDYSWGKEACSGNKLVEQSLAEKVMVFSEMLDDFVETDFHID
jgi:hypothetical protein